MIHHHLSGKRGLWKRIFSICIALALICGVSVPASAVSASNTEGDEAGGAAEPAVTYTFYVDETEYATQTVQNGEELVQPEDPSADGKTFDGWYTAESGGEKFESFGVQTVTETADVSLYAGWTVSEPEEEPNTPGNERQKEGANPAEPTDITGDIPVQSAVDEPEQKAESPEQDISTLAISDLNTVEVGDTITLTGTSGVGTWSHNWNSSNSTVATVAGNNSGATVTGVSEGTVTITHTYNKAFNGQQRESFTVKVIPATYELYTYTLIPGKDLTTANQQPNANWNGMGVGTITGVASPSTKDLDEVLYRGDSQIRAQENIKFPGKFPDITVDGNTYTYAEQDSPQATQKGYYTIEWYNVVVADGANAGNNNYIQEVPAGTNTYHLNGLLTLNEENKYTVNFYLKDVNGSSFNLVEPSKYSKWVDEGAKGIDLARPEVKDPDTYPSEKIVDGITYVFDGWYKDKACMDKVVWNTEVITGNTKYYARYIPKTQEITITKLVTGGLGDVKKTFDFSYSYSVNGVGSGNGTFALQDHATYEASSKTISVPVGAQLTITETNGDGYTTTATYDGETVTVSSHSLTVTVESGKGTIVITNDKDVVPDTGIRLTTLPYILTLGLVFAGVAASGLYTSRKRHD